MSVGQLFSASEKRLKFNEKPLVYVLGVINKLVPVEYDQAFVLVHNYTKNDTPQSHQAGFIAQYVHKIDKLKFIIGVDGKDSVWGWSYNVVFTYAVKAIQ